MGVTRQKQLRLYGLVFCYGSFPPEEVSQLNMYIHQGELVAIHGSSGLVKTTLLKLLLGLLQAESGDIHYSGINIRQLDSQYRQRVAAAMQHDPLLSGFLAGNVDLGTPQPADLTQNPLPA